MSKPFNEVIRRVVAYDDDLVPLEERLGERKRGSPAGSRVGYTKGPAVPGPMFSPTLTDEQVMALQNHPRVREIIESARQTAVAEGLEASRVEIDEMRERCAESVVNLNTAAHNAAAWLASEVVELALMVATQIVGHECSLDRDRLKTVIEQSLLSFSDGEEVALCMNTVDLEFVREKYPELEAPAITLKVDDTLITGGYVLESARRVVDASIEAQTEAVRASLVDLLTVAKAESTSEAPVE